MSKLMRWSFAGGLLLCVCSLEAAGLTATIEVNTTSWYAQEQDSRYGGAELTAYYAPLPVFFEGWKSSPRAEIAEYEWDFGDGSPSFSGFNGAHVYEMPGTYTATLTVKDTTGATSTATQQIQVLARDGQTYYVDSDLGDDSNAGTSSGSGAWKTATHAFEGMEVFRYQSGDQILFKRGQTFSFQGEVKPSHYQTGHGYVFGPYGDGAKPIIQFEGGGEYMFKLQGHGLAHVTFEDLEFRCSTVDESVAANLFYVAAYINQVLFHRVDARGGSQIFTISCADDYAGGIFIVECTTYKAGWTHVYNKSSRFALLRNRFDYSVGNHIAYLDTVDKGVISGNTFARPTYGRHAMRLCGRSAECPSNNIWISDNYFKGWLDPTATDADHYNWLLVHLAPNTPYDDKLVQHVVFENNSIVNGETLLNIGAYENLIVRDNVFYTDDYRGSERRIIFGSKHNYDQRPLKDIFFHDNFFMSPVCTDSKQEIFEFREYVGPEFPGRPVHENIVIENMAVLSKAGSHMSLRDSDPVQLDEIDTDHNRIYTTTKDLDQTFELGTSDLDLAGWRTASGNDASTVLLMDTVMPAAGTASSSASVESGPIAVTYTGASDNSGSGLKCVHLWVRKDNGGWIDTGLTSTGASGSFSYAGMTEAGLYRFSVQSEDNDGNVSMLNVYEEGQTTTAYGGQPVPDPDPPVAGTASSPATDDTSPITVTYTGASDSGSGLKEVRLWVKKGAAGDWQGTGLIAGSGSGSFNYAGMSGSDTYYFATRAQDNANNYSAVPSGGGDTNTVYTGTAPSDTTAPVAGTASSAGSATTSPITVTYTGATDDDSGLAEVRLWVKKGASGTWADTGLIQTSASGSFAYAAMSGDDTYYFATRAKDTAGNYSAIPADGGDTSTAYSTSAPPSTSDLLAFLRLDDDASDGAATDSSEYGNHGSFSGTFMPTLGTGQAGGAYVFDGADHVDLGGLDIPGDTLTLAAWFNAEQFTGSMDNRIISKAASRNSGDHYWMLSTIEESGEVRLRFRVKTGGATSTLIASSGVVPTGAWVHAVGTYDGSTMRLYFNAQEVGSMGKTGDITANASVPVWIGDNPMTGARGFVGRIDEVKIYKAALSSADVTALYEGAAPPPPTDTTAPNTGTLSVPATAEGASIPLSYSGASDADSGLATVALWVKKDAGAWAPSGLTQPGASGSFSYTGMVGTGTYSFALQATDNAGNTSAVPSGGGAGSTNYTRVFTAGTASSPQFSATSPVTVTYSGAADSSPTGIKNVHLWVKKGSGAWADSGMTQSGTSGSFSYSAFSGEAAYYFALQAEDNSGALTPAPSGSGDTSTTYDTTPPYPGALSSPTYSAQSPVSIGYVGAEDTGSGLKELRLWTKKGFEGAWVDTGQRLMTPTGTFQYNPIVADDVYFFFVQAEDNAGLTSEEPSDALVFGN